MTYELSRRSNHHKNNSHVSIQDLQGCDLTTRPAAIDNYVLHTLHLLIANAHKQPSNCSGPAS